MDAAILNISYAHGAVHLLEQLYNFKRGGMIYELSTTKSIIKCMIKATVSFH